MKNAPVSQTGFHSHSHSKSQNTHKNKAKKSRLSPKNACRFQHSANEPVRCQGRIPAGTSGSKSSKSRQSSRPLSGANVFISTQAANMQSSERRYFNSAQNRIPRHIIINTSAGFQHSINEPGRCQEQMFPSGRQRHQHRLPRRRHFSSPQKQDFTLYYVPDP